MSIENLQDNVVQKRKKISTLNSEMNYGKDVKLQTYRPQDLIQISDSVYEWQWDTFNPGWEIASKIINIVYDTHNNLINQILQRWNGSLWMNSGHYIFTYDANNNMTGELDQNWNGSSWDNTLQFILTYDANDNQKSQLRQFWNGNAWENSEQFTNTYDANNNKTSALHQFWNGGALADSNLSIYTYDVNNNKTSELDQYWEGSNLLNSYQFTYTYDANNNRTSGSEQGWSESTWVNRYQYTYTYDANNFIKNYSYKYWNNTGTKVTSGDSIYNYYHTVLGMNDLMVQNEKLTDYPNPASEQITVETAAVPSKNQLYVMNLNGQQLITRQITELRTTLDISSLASGVYFVRLTSDKKVATGKIIKQ